MRVSQANLIPRFEQVYGPFLEGEGTPLEEGIPTLKNPLNRLN